MATVYYDALHFINIQRNGIINIIGIIALFTSQDKFTVKLGMLSCLPIDADLIQPRGPNPPMVVSS